MENIYPNKEGYTSQTKEESNPAPIVIPDIADFQPNNLYKFPHKGIFQPNPNTLICKTNCCYKYIGLYIILFGAFFGIIFPTIGILVKITVFIIVGSLIFLITIIVGIILFCKITIEVKFIFSNPMVEIIASSLCSKKNKIVEKSEIANIILEYNNIRQNRVYQSLHIMFKNGLENDYFGFTSNPPCFTKYEVDYFNNEIKRLLNN